MDKEMQDALKEVIAYAHMHLYTMLDELGDCAETASLDNSINMVSGFLIADEAEKFLLTSNSEGGTI